MTIEEVKQAVDTLFSDTSVSKATTKERMEDLKAHIEVCIESLGDCEEDAG